MSQDINLLNPALRPKRDLLCFRNVAAATGAALLLVVVGAAVAQWRLAEGAREQIAVAGQLAQARQATQSMQSALAGRKSDASLDKALERAEAEVAQRRESLDLARGLAAAPGGVAEAMLGFSRQRLEGLWLTGFGIGPGGFDLRGRMLDPLLLPVYIRRLNGEPAFRGRRFAALDMTGVEAGTPLSPPVPTSPAAPAAAPLAAGAGIGAVPAPGAAGPVAAVRFVEFSLRASLPPPAEPAGRAP